MTECVQCRLLLRRPPKAFFMAPVMVVKTWVLRVGRWTMLVPRNISGISIPSGKILSSTSISPCGA